MRCKYVDGEKHETYKQTQKRILQKDNQTNNPGRYSDEGIS